MNNKAPPGRRTLLIIMDGFGISRSTLHNAPLIARTPHLDALFAQYPSTLLEASGPAVGLPPGQIGNSEVGHISIGCGCIIEQDLVRIDKAIEDGSFFENPSLVAAIKKARDDNSPIQLLGLVSDGGVHSHIRHLLALIELCKRVGARPLLHMITDGRDTPPFDALDHIAAVTAALEAAGGAFATVMGRFYAMDRDHRWERTQRAWSALVRGEGEHAANVVAAVAAAHACGIGDEFIEPTVLPGARPLCGKHEHLIVFNFRNDRPRQLVAALASPRWMAFSRGGARPPTVTTITELDPILPCKIAFEPVRPKATLASVVSKAGLEQFHCAETEKFPHVTFFFNGGDEEPLPGETRRLVPSPKVATYDLVPEMSAHAVADRVISALADPRFAFIVVNFANTDMVGHTAQPDPILKAVETVDAEVGRVTAEALKRGWATIITSDHGNCDEMLDPETRQPNTRHTLNPVPCLIVGGDNNLQLTDGCNISNIAPTVLDLMGLPAPPEMQSHSIIVRKPDGDA